MTKKEKINRAIGLSFDFMRKVEADASIVEVIPNGTYFDFVEKDFALRSFHQNKDEEKKVVLIKVKNDLQIV